MLDVVVGYVVVETLLNTSEPPGLVPEFYAGAEDAEKAAKLFESIAQQTGQNENIKYLAAAVVILPGQR
jgi:hypothetical protein